MTKTFIFTTRSSQSHFPTQLLGKIRASLGVHQGVLDPLRQSFGINLKDIVDFTNANRGKSLLVDVNVTIIRAPVASIHVEVNW